MPLEDARGGEGDLSNPFGNTLTHVRLVYEPRNPNRLVTIPGYWHLPVGAGVELHGFEEYDGSYRLTAERKRIAVGDSRPQVDYFLNCARDLDAEGDGEDGSLPIGCLYTYIVERLNGMTNVVRRVPGYWPLPKGGVVEFGGEGGNQDYVVDDLRMRVQRDIARYCVTLYLVVVRVPLGMGLT